MSVAVTCCGVVLWYESRVDLVGFLVVVICFQFLFIFLSRFTFHESALLRLDEQF